MNRRYADMDARPGGLTPAAAALRWSGPQGRRNDTLLVITGLVPVIPIWMALRFSKRDGRHKAGHDREGPESAILPVLRTGRSGSGGECSHPWRHPRCHPRAGGEVESRLKCNTVDEA
jgi:hypothetical protein